MLSSKNKLFLQHGWVYFKVYCEEAYCEILLAKLISPVISTLNKKKLINCFFFIRYRDENGTHLRIRFQCAEEIAYYKVIDVFLDSLSKKSNISKHIASVQLDSYEREISRYGKTRIEKIELIFCADSEINIYLLESEKDIKQRWLKAMALVSVYLKLIGLDYKDSLRLIEKCSQAYLPRFNPDKNEFGKINELYAKHRPQIYAYCDNPVDILKIPVSMVVSLSNSLQELKLLLKSSGAEQTDIFRDLIHMSLNRFLPTNPNKNEFVIYEMLKLFLKSSMYRVTPKNKV